MISSCVLDTANRSYICTPFILWYLSVIFLLNHSTSFTVSVQYQWKTSRLSKISQIPTRLNHVASMSRRDMMNFAMTSSLMSKYQKPHNNKHYQSVCSKNTPISKWLFGARDKLAKNIMDIGEVNKISKKVSPYTSLPNRGKSKSTGQHSASFSPGKRASS